MICINIVAVGKIKNLYYRGVFNEYLKMLNPYAKIYIKELKSEPFRGNSQKIKAKKNEGERMLKELDNKKNKNIFLLTENGKQFNSLQFSKLLEKYNSEITFVIGGALGFSNSVLEKYKNTISLSKMTFPHEMARVILLEQIYRGITISKDKEYHY